MKCWILFSSLIITTSTGACSSAIDDSNAHTFHVSEKDGVRIVESSSFPKYAEDLFTYQRILKITPDPQIPESVLFKPRPPVLRDIQGRFHVPDGGDMRIAVFSPEGRFLFQYGRPGDGPGEFRALMLQSIRDELVSIYDSRLYRTSLFTIDGELVDVFPVLNRSPSLRQSVRLIDGTIVCSVDDLIVDDTFQFKQSNIIVFSADGDTISHIQTPFIETMFIMLEQGRRIGASALPYRAIPTVLFVSPDRILKTVGYEPEIQLFSLFGELTDLIRLNLEPFPVTPVERRQIIEEYGREDEFHGVGPSPEFINSAKESMRFPDFKSFWVSVYVDDNGYFWLRNWESTYRMLVEGGPSFRVLSPEGEYIGNTRWPGSSGVITNDLLLSWETEWETGEFLPVIYRMIPAVADFSYPEPKD